MTLLPSPHDTCDGRACRSGICLYLRHVCCRRSSLSARVSPVLDTKKGTTVVTKTVTVAGARLTGVGANGRTTSLQSLYILLGTVRTPTAIGVTGVISGAAAPDTSGATTAVGDLLQLRIAGAGASNQGQRRFSALLRLSYNRGALPAGVMAGSLAVYRFDPLTDRYTRVVSRDNGQGSVLSVITTNVPSRDYFELRGRSSGR